MNLLEFKNKYNIENPKKTSDIVENNFFGWTSGNFYRTSYNDMGSRSPAERKNAAIPGYKGFVPGMKNGTLIGKRYTESTRQSLTRENLDLKPQLFSSTGFNFSKIPRQDETLHAVSPKYGKSTIMDTAPNMKPDSWTTNARSSYYNPVELPRENWRAKQSSIQFDDQSQAQNNQKRAQRVNSSGFSQNSTLFDGTGWTTEKNLHGDQFRTAYRNQYNQDKPFHKVQPILNNGRLRKRELVYDKH
eukprot:403346645